MAESVILKPIPQLTEEQPYSRLLEFYRKLGWDGQGVVDPSRVRVHESDFRRLVAEEMAHAGKVVAGANELDIALGAGILWVNMGPSGGGGSPGFVELHPGWLAEQKDC